MKAGAVAMTVCALTTSCSNNDFEPMTQAEIDKAKYDQVFINYVGGSIAPNQTWGFDANSSGSRLMTRAASKGSTEATTNATLLSDWSDQKTNVTCDEGVSIEYQVTYTVVDSHPASDKLGVETAYAEVLPEGQNNISKIAATNKEEFVTTEAGEISYIVLPGVTAGTNDRIGYYYYTTSCNIKTLHKYVLTNDPANSYIGEGAISDVKDENGAYMYTQKERKFKAFKLIYVDEQGNASYTFPKGVNVGFFTQTVEAGSKKTVELYSRGELNEGISNWLKGNSYDGEGWGNSATNSHVAIFSYKGYNFVGFEDWYDYDYNDMVLSVTGNIEPATIVNIDDEDGDDENGDDGNGDEGNDDELVYDLRIIAEDLSATSASDFDFNDVVFDVKYDAENAYINLLAAGGTLPLRIEGKEVHALFNVAEDYMVNTNARKLNLKGNDRDMEPVPFRLGRGINNAAEAKTIKIEVYKNKEWQELKAEQGEPASKIAVGTDFTWLDERTSIKDEFPTFAQWASNNPALKWW